MSSVSDSALSKSIFQAFRGKGLSVTSQAISALTRVLKQEDKSDFREILASILSELTDRIEKREVSTTVIDLKIIESIVADLSSSEDDIRQESIQLYDAFHSPKLQFDERQKTYKIVPDPPYSLFGGINSRAQMYRERILLAQQRLLRSGMFVIRGMERNGPHINHLQDVHELSMIESLLGSSGSRLLFGMITQPQEGSWSLEDLSSSIPLNISQASISEGLLTEGCLVIVLGEYDGGVFRVQNIGFPPAETRQKTLSSIGIVDPFGSGVRPQLFQHFAELEAEAVDAMMIIVSDIQLEKPLVLEKLRQLFRGFEDSEASPLFILMGSFISKPATTAGGRTAAQASYRLLADTIASCPHLAKNAKFVIVPGVLDPGISRILPRPQIPELFTTYLSKKVSHITFATNPARLRFFTQEIVLFREDLQRYLQRHTMRLPSRSNNLDHSDEESGSEVAEQVVLSLLDQAHLWPLPAHVKPLYWELDHAMRLSPLPHLLVLGDRAEQFCYDYSGCKAVNPGSFTSDHSFLVYRPASGDVEFSRVPA